MDVKHPVLSTVTRHLQPFGECNINPQLVIHDSMSPPTATVLFAKSPQINVHEQLFAIYNLLETVS